MTALALALHTLGAVVWVGGMFAIYVCLRPALGTLEPPERSGYWMVFTAFKQPDEQRDHQPADHLH